MVLIIAAGETDRTVRYRTCEATRWHSPRYLIQYLRQAARTRRHGRILFSGEEHQLIHFMFFFIQTDPRCHPRRSTPVLGRLFCHQIGAVVRGHRNMLRVVMIDDLSRLVSLSTRCHRRPSLPAPRTPSLIRAGQFRDCRSIHVSTRLAQRWA